MILSKMHITKFRNLENIEFKFGKHLTVIAGRNGTSKTSLLGLIIQPFSFPKTKGGATIFDTPFDTLFSEIHKITDDDKDSSGSIKHYSYSLFSDLTVIPVKGATEYPKSPKERHRFKAGVAHKDKGNVIFPTLYLGLKRLFPMGEHTDDEIKEKKRTKFTPTEEDNRLYHDMYNKVFSSNVSSKIESSFITAHKSTINTRMGNDYGIKSFSAGQDSFTQIFGALLSYRKLKEKLGDKYQGGIICIDEVETTFHPIALRNLFETLKVQAKDLQLQIIVTTHSLDLIKLAYSPEYKDITEVVYLKNMGGTVKAEENASYLSIERDMYLTAINPIKPSIYLLCEDDEAVEFLKIILSPELSEKVQIISAKLGHPNLTVLSKSGVMQVSNLIFLLDGDQHSDPSNRILTLPGEKTPEEILYEIMNENRNTSKFWIWQGDSPDLFLGNYPQSPYKATANKTARENAKEFFKHIKKTNEKMIAYAYEQWSEQHQKDVKTFNSELASMIGKISKGKD